MTRSQISRFERVNKELVAAFQQAFRLGKLEMWAPRR